MPTNLDRVQTLLQPNLFAQVRTLAKHSRRSNSYVCAELVEDALKLSKWQQRLEDAEIQVPAKPDPRDAIRQPQLRYYTEVEPAPIPDRAPIQWWKECI